MSSQTLNYDKDLQSIQQARELLAKAKIAQKDFEQLSQEQVDKVIKHVAYSIFSDARLLADIAVTETGYGNVKDKTFKNEFSSKGVYEYIKDMKTRGIINIDDEKKLWDVGVALGVIVGLIPSTNPTSTVIYKTLISLKSGNAIVFSPHPAAMKCITKTVELIQGYLVEAGVSSDLVGVLTILTMEGTDTLMKSDDTATILATGGSAMVKAAYSSGNPALGVGPGNVPAFISGTANVPDAVKKIIDSKTFDGGVVCASEQAVVVEQSVRNQAIAEFRQQGAHFVSDQEKRALEHIITLSNGQLNPKIVGQSPQRIAQMAGFTVSNNIRLLVGFETEVGRAYPFSVEKLSPILGFYTEENWEKGCEKCIELLELGGLGHSLAIHSTDMDVIREFALRKPVSRILVNTPSTHGAIGASTSLAPSMTLGCGAVGGSATSDNITPLNLLNIRRVAFGFDNIESSSPVGEDQIADIVRKIVAELNQ